jgi:hypothetical protein
MGNKISRILVAGLCLLTLAVVDASAASGRSAVGTWKLNVAQSSYGKTPAPKVELLVVAVDKPDALQWKLTGASADGKTYFSSYDGAVDSKFHPMVSSEAGGTVAYTRTPDGGVKWIVKDKNGNVIETGASQLSPNGDTLTLKGAVQGPNGKENFVSVFQRAQ